ncbi:hypothetical protein BTW15_23350 [Pseudomonas syringae pv. tomato]|uniref:Uncharacterized protein n=2 Tax=Pseudomonas syringae group TaxID=136849 RepID=A0AAW4DZE3_PSESX|nr:MULTISPECIES: hypothetical protein [Pseudomonas syringae group]AVI82481.1 hypothetical protein XJ28_01265 [Pseudomonas syringae pv. tomato]EEB56596.1 hypothetical protein PSPTOT1_2908 [Pseudomonas syringae pv. tomato T1]KGK93456.1 hypothetical protein NB04_20960 [Pseudomonas syringae pv. tomato]KUR42447.1 hypothetical protein PST407_05534 [Pseudomonas syringae pv. tomato]KUR45829.1 hypothetical protein PSTA9_02296 [Pseudomonas syringae pv. tomato]
MSEELILKIIYDTGLKTFNELDFYHGSKSLAAISEAFILTTNAALNQELISRTTAAKGFRSALRKNFKGSFVQTIALIIEDAEVLAQYKKISFEGYAEFLKIIFGAAIGKDYEATRRGSKKLLNNLDDLETLIQRVENIMLDLHSPIKYQGLKVNLAIGPRKIEEFDYKSLSYVDDEIKGETIIELVVGVSKFNGRTGTGRFIYELDGESFPFYPVRQKITQDMMELLSTSLNDMTSGTLTKLRANVITVHAADGRLKRVILHEVKTLQ